jgi:diaminopimelate epimerase
VAKYVYDHGIVSKEMIEVETLSGIKQVVVTVQDGQVKHAKVDMGKATGLKTDETTLLEGQSNFLTNFPIQAADNNWVMTTISMGNPHCVVFLPDIAGLDLPRIGPFFEKHPFFPQKINTEFVRVISPTELEMRVWERGSGETLACGTGACAAVMAAILNGYSTTNVDVTVRLLGGELIIRVTDETVYMTGDAVEIFAGDIVL